MKQINYTSNSVEEIAIHFESIKASALSRAFKRSLYNPELYNKLLKACIISKIAKLQKQLEALN